MSSRAGGPAPVHDVYTDPAAARRRLDQQRRELSTLPPSVRLSYHLQRANLLTQEYYLEEADEAYRAAVTLADDHGTPAERLEVYLDYAGHLTNLEELERAADYLDRADRLFSTSIHPGTRARAHCRRGYLELHLLRYQYATREFEAAAALLDGIDEPTAQDHYFYCLIDSGLGQVNEAIDERAAARQAFERAIDRCNRIGLSARLPWLQLNLGKQLYDDREHAAALEYFDAIIESGANGSAPALAAANANASLCYLHLGRIEAAHVHLDVAEKIYRTANGSGEMDVAALESTRGGLFMEEEKWAEATDQFQQLLQRLEKLPDDGEPVKYRMLIADAYLNLGICYAQRKDYRTAYHCQEHYNEWQLELQRVVDAVRQRQFAVKHRVEERDRENRRLRHEADQLKMKALRAQMNPHFLYNALNSIQSFILTNETAAASRFLAKFAMLMRRGLEYSNRERISLAEERQFLVDYLEINRHLRFEGQLTYEVMVDEELDEDFMGVPTMILQPYVENAIEHGLRGLPRGHVNVAFLADGPDHLLATVEDNGMGRRKAAELQAGDAARGTHKSRGTEITESRLRLLGDAADVWVSTEDLYAADGSGAGTRVRVRIPVSDLIGH